MAGGVVNVRAQAVVKVQSPRGESEGRQGSSPRGSSVRGGTWRGLERGVGSRGRQRDDRGGSRARRDKTGGIHDRQRSSV